jgi:RND family efflux transporter MFP subunit
MSQSRSVLAAVGMVVGTALLAAIVIWTEPEPKREAAVRRTPMLVEVVEVTRGTHIPAIPALGAVRAAEDVQLQAQVAGRVAWLSPELVPGTVVDEGTVLLRIEPDDARNALVQATSARQLAEADLALEEGRQAVARTERDSIEGEISEVQERLILREPQLLAARATLESAKARERQARLTLSRTEVKAPFRALVLSREVGQGSLVGTGSVLGRVVAVDEFWVELTVPQRVLAHLPDGTPVELHDPAAWSPGTTRTGQLHGIVRALDTQTRLARLLVKVDDPLGLTSDGPPLTVGAFVEAELQAKPLADVVRLPRTLVRKGGVVWTMVDGALQLPEVTVVLEDDQYAYISEGLAPGDQVVTTDLSTVSAGAPLRVAEAAP